MLTGSAGILRLKQGFTPLDHGLKQLGIEMVGDPDHGAVGKQETRLD